MPDFAACTRISPSRMSDFAAWSPRSAHQTVPVLCPLPPLAPPVHPDIVCQPSRSSPSPWQPRSPQDHPDLRPRTPPAPARPEPPFPAPPRRPLATTPDHRPPHHRHEHYRGYCQDANRIPLPIRPTRNATCAPAKAPPNSPGAAYPAGESGSEPATAPRRPSPEPRRVCCGYEIVNSG